MKQRIGAYALALAVAAVVGTPLLAFGQQEPSSDELRAQIRDLQARLAAVEQKQATTSEAHETLEKVLQDAETRSKLLNFGSDLETAGYNKTFFIRSTDGNFTLQPGAQFQFRYVATARSDAKNGGTSDDIQSGFEVRRLKLSLEGNAFTPKFGYYFQWATDRSGGDVSLDDAVVRYQLGTNWTLKVGQYKDPVFHEELNPDKTLMTVERSMLNELLGGGISGRVQGAGVIYGSDANPFYAEAMFHDGDRSLNTNFQDSPGGLGAGVKENFGIGGRVAYKFMGEWKDYKDFTAKDAKHPLLVGGVGGDWTQGDNVDAYLSTVDLQYEHPSGFAAYGALIGDFFQTRNAATDDHFDYGGLVQVGYMLTRSWEVFGAYDVVVFDDAVTLSTGGTEDTFHEIVGGVNYYFGPDGSWGHKAKFTLDAAYLPSGAPRNISGSGILESEEAEFILRGQFQLLL
jgi:hypothetical protein